MNPIDTSFDIIDSRDVIERIDELEAIDDRDDLEESELAVLLRLQQEGEQCSEDWSHGIVLIRDSHFKHYARELAEETCAISIGVSWPYTCIDWGQAAEELSQDYSVVDFDGVSYWVRL